MARPTILINRMGRPRSCECGACKKCRKRIYMSNYYARHPEKLKDAREHQRRKWREQPELMREKNRNRRTPRAKQKHDPVKIAANKILGHAVAIGRISREPCLFCGDEWVV